MNQNHYPYPPQSNQPGQPQYAAQPGQPQNPTQPPYPTQPQYPQYAQGASQPPTPTRFQQPQPGYKSPAKSHKKLILVAVLLATILVLGASGAYIFRDKLFNTATFAYV